MSQPVNFFGTEFFAALAGACVAGAISLALQWQSFDAQKKSRRREREQELAQAEERKREREAVLAFSTMVKINRALSVIEQIKRHLEEAFRESVTRKMELANAVHGFSADFDRIAFSVDELAFARHFRKSELVNDLVDLPAILDLYVDNMAVIRRLKGELSDLATSIKMDRRGRAVSSYTVGNADKAKLKVAQANLILQHLLARSIDDYRLAHNLFFDFQEASTDRLGQERLRVVWDIKRLPDRGTSPTAKTAARTVPAPPDAAAPPHASGPRRPSRGR